MRTWSYSTNSYSKYGSVDVEEMPLWLWLLDKFADNSCSYIPSIPFPNFPKKSWKNSDGEEYTPREWFGDLQDYWCSVVCRPLLQYVINHPKRKEYRVEVGYDKIKELFSEVNPEFFE